MKRLISLAALMLCLAPVANAQQNVNYTTVDFPGAVGETGVLALNNCGDFVGEYVDAAQHYHGFLARRERSGIKFTKIDYPGSVQTLAAGINDFGIITGNYLDANGTTHGFVRLPLPRPVYIPVNHPDAVTSFDYDWEIGPGLSTVVIGLNDFGDFVGQYADSHQAGRGFVFHNGRFIHFDHPQASGVPGFFGQTSMFRINNLSDIVGGYGDSPDPAIPSQHGYLYHNGRFTTIDPPGSLFTQTFALNDRRDVGGFFYDINFIGRAFFYRNGQYTIFDVPGAVSISTVASLNNNGDFGGEFVDALGITHGYIAARR